MSRAVFQLPQKFNKKINLNNMELVANKLNSYIINNVNRMNSNLRNFHHLLSYLNLNTKDKKLLYAISNKILNPSIFDQH